MIKGTTSTGFEFEVTDETLDDYELLSALEEIYDGNYTRIVTLTNLLLGKEQQNRLKEHVKTLNGKVTASGMVKEVFEILNFNDSTKNS